MRLHFSLSPNTEPVPFNYFHFLVGAFHRTMGENDLHDALSLYSLGGLQGGGARGAALNFPRGASWFVSAPDTDAGHALLSRLAQAALREPRVCCGMEVVQIEAQPTPEFGPRRVFRANTPIFIRGDKEDDKDPHILYDDPRATELLTRTLRHKLDKAGLSQFSADIRFDSSYRSPKTHLIFIKEGFDKEGNRKDFRKRANVCPVIVTGDAEAVKFVWNTGAGNLTGSCFGSLI